MIYLTLSSNTKNYKRAPTREPRSQVIKYQRQRVFHIPELGKFLKTAYRRLRRHPRSLVFSLRSAAANNGISDRLISKQDRWSLEKSEERLY